MALKPVHLQDFLRDKPSPQLRNLPLVHSTQSSRLLDVLNASRLLATKCNVFKDEKLCYLFVGRPAYKYEMAGEAPYWMLPTVFVMRFASPPPIKRIYPFDSGAFATKRLPDYITTFERDDFEMGEDLSVASKAVEVFFKTEKRYLARQTSSSDDFAQEHKLTALHMQIAALNQLYGDRSNSFDDRAACIEVQSEKDIELLPANVLGIVVPEPFMDDPDYRAALLAISPNIETYGIFPLNVSMYFSAIYDAVRRIYSIFGITR